MDGLRRGKLLSLPGNEQATGCTIFIISSCTSIVCGSNNGPVHVLRVVKKELAKDYFYGAGFRILAKAGSLCSLARPSIPAQQSSQTIQNYQRDALNIIYSSNITLLYMFRVSSTHLQEDTVVHEQHMVPSLSIRVPSVLLICSYREN